MERTGIHELLGRFKFNPSPAYEVGTSDSEDLCAAVLRIPERLFVSDFNFMSGHGSTAIKSDELNSVLCDESV